MDCSITIKKETHQFLWDLANRMIAQDNRATAFPYFYVIRQPRWRPTPEGYGYGETKHIFFDSEGQREYSTKEDYIKDLIEEGISAKEAHMKAEDELQELYVEQYFDEDNIFLTEEGYERHLKLNRHNLKEPHSYVKHCFRNPEMEGLLKAIFEVAGLDLEEELKKKEDAYQARLKEKQRCIEMKTT
jgi:hypothetical protein